jgi:hypothetical protein
MENQPTQAPERMSLPTETLSEILSFLSTMPYNQVVNLITKIQGEAKLVPEVEEKSPKTIPLPKKK